MNLAWYVGRLRAMSVPELFYRVAQAGRRRGRRLSARGPDVAQALPLPSRPATLPLRVRFFEIDLPYPTAAQPIDWSRDYKNGVSAPLLFYGNLDYRNAAQVGDSKYTWELNRHQFIVPWAREYRRTGDEAVAAATVDLILDWIHRNPRHLGINWSSALELALRILSWGIALDLCSGSAAAARARPVVAKSVAQQALYVRRTLSFYSSANNHLMGELVGLLAAGAFFPEARGVRGYAEFARRRLPVETLLQNLPDGVNREQAIYYHHYTLEYVLTAVALFERCGWGVPSEVSERALRMLEFLDAMVDGTGEPFEIGDSDDGAVTGLNLGTGTSVYESLLWTGHLLFGEAGFGAHAGAIARARGAVPEPDPKTCYWFPKRKAAAVPSEWRGRRRVFPEGGYFVSTDDGFTLLFKAGPFGYPSIAAHSHCDQLSVGLKRGGTTILTDAGTFVYHTEDRWRRFFRGTSAHNTVRVDERDQAEYAGPFLWSTHADARLEVVADGPNGFSVLGRHHGYERLPDPVAHERRVTHRPGQGYLVVDRLSGQKPHRYELFWNLGHEIELQPREVAPSDAGWSAWTAEAPGQPAVVLLIGATKPLDVRAMRGDAILPAGFESRKYLTKEPSFHLRATASDAEIVFRTFIFIDPSLRGADLFALAREWAKEPCAAS